MLFHCQLLNPYFFAIHDVDALDRCCHLLAIDGVDANELRCGRLGRNGFDAYEEVGISNQNLVGLRILLGCQHKVALVFCHGACGCLDKVLSIEGVVGDGIAVIVFGWKVGDVDCTFTGWLQQ